MFDPAETLLLQQPKKSKEQSVVKVEVSDLVILVVLLCVWLLTNFCTYYLSFRFNTSLVSE